MSWTPSFVDVSDPRYGLTLPERPAVVVRLERVGRRQHDPEDTFRCPQHAVDLLAGRMYRHLTIGHCLDDKLARLAMDYSVAQEPIPPDGCVCHIPPGDSGTAIACEHCLADPRPLQAEIERLQAEIDSLRAAADTDHDDALNYRGLVAGLPDSKRGPR